MSAKEKRASRKEAVKRTAILEHLNRLHDVLGKSSCNIGAMESIGTIGIDQTFAACIQSVMAMIALASHLISEHGFKYVLSGKFNSDPIEGRFGWYRHVNGGNCYKSILQLFQAEKKIRCLSLLQQMSLHLMCWFEYQRLSLITECNESTEDLDWLLDWFLQIQVNEVRWDDVVIYYVAGCIGKCLSLRKKCSSCTDLLIDGRTFLV